MHTNKTKSLPSRNAHSLGGRRWAVNWVCFEVADRCSGVKWHRGNGGCQAGITRVNTMFEEGLIGKLAFRERRKGKGKGSHVLRGKSVSTQLGQSLQGC